jgi:hypothetical protein
VIDDYLAELRQALRWRFVSRRRLLAEAEAHLRDSAAALRGSGLTDEAAEHEAVARFGSPRIVAAEVVRTAWPRSLVLSALVLLGALTVYFLPLYAIPENTLPPAPWVERPGYLTWKLYVSLGAYGFAVGAALFALAAAWRSRARVAAGALAAALAAFAASAALGTVLAVQWAAEVDGSGAMLAASLPAAALATVVAALAATIAVVQAPLRPRRG